MNIRIKSAGITALILGAMALGTVMVHVIVKYVPSEILWGALAGLFAGLLVYLIYVKVLEQEQAYSDFEKK